MKYLHLRPYIFIKCDGSSTRLYGRVNSPGQNYDLGFEQSFGVLDLDTDTEIEVTIGYKCKLAYNNCILTYNYIHRYTIFSCIGTYFTIHNKHNIIYR